MTTETFDTIDVALGLGISVAGLRRWLYDEGVKLDLDKGRKRRTTMPREFTLRDVATLALTKAMTAYGFTVPQAYGLAKIAVQQFVGPWTGEEAPPAWAGVWAGRELYATQWDDGRVSIAEYPAEGPVDGQLVLRPEKIIGDVILRAIAARRERLEQPETERSA